MISKLKKLRKQDHLRKSIRENDLEIKKKLRKRDHLRRPVLENDLEIKKLIRN